MHSARRGGWRARLGSALAASVVVLLTACGGGGSSGGDLASAQSLDSGSADILAKKNNNGKGGSTTTGATTTGGTTTGGTTTGGTTTGDTTTGGTTTGGTTTGGTTTGGTTTGGTTTGGSTIVGRIVGPEFFGMHLAAQTYDGWPTVKFSIQRTWDSWPGVAWADINPSNGVYNWSNLDALVNDSLAHGVDLVYTFGYTPTWASSNPGGACDGGGTASCYAPNSTAWTNFVSALTTRYKGKIKYYELWNEPNAGNFWKGSNAQLVEMARLAYPIIKNAGASMLSPAPQGSSSASWLDGYLAAGGTSYTDILAFHGYLYGPPEYLNALMTDMRSLRSKYGISGKPLWDTEHSWGDSTWPMGGDQDQQAAWLARYLVLSVHHAIDRSFWYGWEHFNWGTLYDRTTKTVLKPGIAYGQVYDWLLGAGFSPCVTSGNLYTCKLSRANGYEAQIVWSASGSSSYVAPSGYSRMRMIDGSSTAVSAGQTLTVGMKPVLVEKLQ